MRAYRGYTRSRTGRRRYLKDIKSKDWNKRVVSERCALNTPIQGTSSRHNKNSHGKDTKGITRKRVYKTLASNT
ncbi:DNA polymerase [Clostridium perfringens]|nr:DNA polymerase [Clostridium perfringens]